MDSLTTAYLVCMLIGSGCAVGGAFAGNRITPIESSDKSDTPVSDSEETALAASPTTKQSTPAYPENKQPAKPNIDVKSEISKGFGGDDSIADSIMLFLKTPVKEWRTISEDFPTLTKKFRQTMTHPNMNKCPQNLLKVCDIVSKKYSNIKDYVQGNSFTELGDQTAEAARLLENTAQTQPAASSTAQ